VEAIMIAARVKLAWLAAMLLAAQLAASAGSAAAPQAQQPPDAAAKTEDLTPEQRMQRRFPQPVRVGDLIGLPVLDYGDSTIGYIRQVVRTPDDKIKLIVPYGHWFGWARTECFLAWCRRRRGEGNTDRARRDDPHCNHAKVIVAAVIRVGAGSNSNRGTFGQPRSSSVGKSAWMIRHTHP
jgi:hypothetical protein